MPINAPTDVANCWGWWDASDLSSIATGAGGSVTQWNDKSGNAHHVSTGASAQKPVSGIYSAGGHNVLYFNGNDGVGLAVTGLLSINTLTVFMVFRPDVINSGRIVSAIKFGGDDFSTTNGFEVDPVNSVRFNNAQVGITPSRFALNQPLNRFTFQRNGASWTCWLNSAAGTGGSSVTTNFAPDWFEIGCRADETQDYFSGVICEVIVYNAAISTANWLDVEAYLTAKWVSPQFPYQKVLLSARQPQLSVPLLGGPLFRQMAAPSGGNAVGTGAAYDAVISSQSNANTVPHREVILRPKSNVVGVPMLGSPLFAQRVQIQSSAATGTGAAYDASPVWAQNEVMGTTAALLRAAPNRLGTPILGSPEFAQRIQVAPTTATATGTAYNATITATEYQRPIADIAAGSWTVAPLWSKVDEVTADDSDFITSETLVAPGNTSSTDLRLSATGDPLSSVGQIISVRAKVTFTLGLNGGIRGELRQGNNVTSTLIATLTTDALATSFVTYTYTLSGGEADSITDYGDLFLRLYGNFPVGSLGGVTVSWVQFQQPAGITPDISVYPTQAAGTGTAGDATTKIAVGGGIATGSGTAGNSAGSVAGTSGQATGTGAANSPAGADAATGGIATGTGTANDATVIASGATNANAGIAAGIGQAYDATTTGTTATTPETVAATPGSSNRRGPYMTLERAQTDDEECILLLV